MKFHLRRHKQHLSKQRHAPWRRQSQSKFIRVGGNKKQPAGEQDRKTDGAEKAVRQKDKKRTVKQAWNGKGRK